MYMYIQEDYLNHDQSILIDLFVITLSLDNSVISLFICSFHIMFEYQISNTNLSMEQRYTGRA